MPDEIVPEAFSADDLIAETAQEEATFEILMKSGKKIVVRKIVNYRTLVSMSKRADKIFASAQKGAVPPAWKPYLPITQEVARIVADFTALIVEPKFTDVQVMELCQKAGPTAVYLHGMIKQSWAEAIPVAEAEEIEEEKEP